jgi:metal-responsive CopG/Arc/MetJ family transcriptional regulator
MKIDDEHSGAWEHNYLVRIKTSITLPKDLLDRLDRVNKNRSALLERAARAYLARLEKQALDQKDIEVIDLIAKRLNREVMDTLEYQQLP